MEEQDNIQTESTQETRRTGKKGLAGFLGRLDNAGESGLLKLLLNLPFVMFLVFLAALHIANNHAAQSYSRRIIRTEKEVKQLRWKCIATTSDLMKNSKQSEVAGLVKDEGLKELRVPPYKITAPPSPGNKGQ